MVFKLNLLGKIFIFRIATPFLKREYVQLRLWISPSIMILFVLMNTLPAKANVELVSFKVALLIFTISLSFLFTLSVRPFKSTDPIFKGGTAKPLELLFVFFKTTVITGSSKVKLILPDLSIQKRSLLALIDTFFFFKKNPSMDREELEFTFIFLKFWYKPYFFR